MADPTAFGYLVIYVDDFLVVSDDPWIDAVRDALNHEREITDKPTVHFGSSMRIEYLSVNITAERSGLFLGRRVYWRDLFCKWSMDECRAISSL